jgi:hypothetical protein
MLIDVDCDWLSSAKKKGCLWVSSPVHLVWWCFNVCSSNWLSLPAGLTSISDCFYKKWQLAKKTDREIRERIDAERESGRKSWKRVELGWVELVEWKAERRSRATQIQFVLRSNQIQFVLNNGYVCIRPLLQPRLVRSDLEILKLSWRTVPTQMKLKMMKENVWRKAERESWMKSWKRELDHFLTTPKPQNWEK